MRAFFGLIILCYCLSVRAECSFRKEVKKIISFSGTTTVLLKEMDLIHHPKLAGISVFNPVSDFKGQVYPGGIFLSQNTFKDFQDAVVFYDESRDLRRIFNSQKIQSKEMRTRGFTPLRAVELGLKVINEFTEGCEENTREVLVKVQKLQNEILKSVVKYQTIVFYLGEMNKTRAPELVMANDGIVTWLVQNKKIKTYPSELSYVNWSPKVLQELPKESLHLGLKDSGNKSIKSVIKKDRHVTLIYPGILVPGVTQLEGCLYLLENL